MRKHQENKRQRVDINIYVMSENASQHIEKSMFLKTLKKTGRNFTEWTLLSSSPSLIWIGLWKKRCWAKLIFDFETIFPILIPNSVSAAECEGIRPSLLARWIHSVRLRRKSHEQKPQSQKFQHPANFLAINSRPSPCNTPTQDAVRPPVQPRLPNICWRLSKWQMNDFNINLRMTSI